MTPVLFFFLQQATGRQELCRTYINIEKESPVITWRLTRLLTRFLEGLLTLHVTLHTYIYCGLGLLDMNN